MGLLKKSPSIVQNLNDGQTDNEVSEMSKVMFDELKRIDDEMNRIAKRSEREGRICSREEQDVLDQLASDKEELMGDIIFYGYGKMR